MKTSSVYLQADIKQVGIIAQRCLTPGHRGNVLAAFSKAIYLLEDDGELFWLATEDAPIHRRCAQISSALPATPAGSLYRVGDHRIITDLGSIRVENPSLWTADHIDPKHALPVKELPIQVDSLFSKLDLSQARGIGAFIPSIQSLSQDNRVVASFSDPILRSTQPHVLNMASACLHHESSQILECADALIGLGAGLTPSGDDFVGGMLFAMKMIQTTYPNFWELALPIENYWSRTHLISFTLLKDLANGHGMEPLHQILNGLLRGKSFESIYPFISQLLQIGHSTGWDLLAGLLTGMLVTYQNNNTSTSLPLHQSMEA